MLAWGYTVGLVESSDRERIASELGADAMELCGIVSHIGVLLQKFKDINKRWKNESRHSFVDGRAVVIHTNLKRQIPKLEIVYENKQNEREEAGWANHLVGLISKGAGNAKDIATHPRRVRWVAVDKQAFEALLRDLHSLIDRLNELVTDHRDKRIDEITAKTFREMVIVRNELGELKAMFDAVTSFLQLSARTGTVIAARDHDSHETFRDLLRLKEIKCVSEQILRKMGDSAELDVNQDMADIIDISSYDGASLSDHFSYHSEKDINFQLHKNRPRGVLTKEGKGYEVWIEWRAVQTFVRGTVEDKESKLRTAMLAQMLSVGKPRHLLSPTCIGFVDDRERKSRLGWIFEMPHGSTQATSLQSLHNVLGRPYSKPPLAQRISLSRKLAISLLHLHTANWLHKGIHSGNVIFPCEHEQIDFENPVLSGFEYSRPQTNETTSRSLDARWDIYRWPSIQNEAPRVGRTRKTYDIYSLGLLFVGIAHWQPLHKLMRLKRWPEPSTQDSRIRGWLLGQEPSPPFENANPLQQLRIIAGENYWTAARRCLTAHGEEGLRIREEDDQSHGSQVGIDLQEAFTELVVEELDGFSI